MRTMITPLLVAVILAVASTAQAAISILYPNTNTIWYKNNTVALNWTLSSPETDTYPFRVLLSNQDQSLLSGNTSLADSTNATAAYVRFLLPGVQAGKGYLVNLVNTTNVNQVFATSQAFEIQDGTVASTTASGSISQTFTVNNIPNAQTQPSYPSSFPSSTSAAEQAVTLVIFRPTIGLAAMTAIFRALI